MQEVYCKGEWESMIKRYLRVLRLLWLVSFAAELEYRVNFIVAVITSLGGLVGLVWAVFVLP